MSKYNKRKFINKITVITFLVFTVSLFSTMFTFPDNVFAGGTVESKLNGMRVNYVDSVDSNYEMDIIINTNISYPEFEDGETYKYNDTVYENTIITSDSSSMKSEIFRLNGLANALAYKDLILFYLEKRYPKAAAYLYAKSAFDSWDEKDTGLEAFSEMYADIDSEKVDNFDAAYWSAVAKIKNEDDMSELLEEMIDNATSTGNTGNEGFDEETKPSHEFSRSAVVEYGFRELVEAFTKEQLEIEPLAESQDGMGLSYRDSQNIKLTTLYQLKSIKDDKAIFVPAKLKDTVLKGLNTTNFDYYIYIPEDLLDKNVIPGDDSSETFQELIDKNFNKDENLEGDGAIVDGILETTWAKEAIEGKFLKVFDLRSKILRLQLASAIYQFQENSIGDLNGNDVIGKAHGVIWGSPANIIDCYLTIDNIGNICLNTKEVLIPWYENRFFVDNNLVGANLFVGSTYVNEAILSNKGGYVLSSPPFRIYSDGNKVMINPRNFTSQPYSTMYLLGIDEISIEEPFFGEGQGLYSEDIFFNIGKDAGSKMNIFSPVTISNSANVEKQLAVLGEGDGSVFSRMKVLNEVLGQAKDDITEVSTSYFPFNPFRDPSAVSPDFSDSSTVEKTQDSVLNMVQETLSGGLMGIISKTFEALTAMVYNVFFIDGCSSALFYSPNINEITLFKVARNYIIGFAIIALLILVMFQFIMMIRGRLSVKDIIKGVALTLVCVFVPLTILPWIFCTVFNGTTNYIMSKEVNAAVVADINSINRLLNSSMEEKLTLQENIDASGSYLSYGDMDIPLLILIPWEVPEGEENINLIEMLNASLEESNLMQFNKYNDFYNNDMMKEIKNHYRKIIDETRVEGADCRINQKVGFLDKYTPAFVSKEDSAQKMGENKPYRYIDHYYNSLKINELLANSNVWYMTYYYCPTSSPEERPFTYEGNLVPEAELDSFLLSLNYVTSNNRKERIWQSAESGLTNRQKDKIVTMVEDISDEVAKQMEMQFGESGNNYLGTSTFYETYLNSITLYTYLAIMKGTATIVDNRQDFLKTVPTSVGIDTVDTDIFIRSLLSQLEKLATAKTNTVAYHTGSVMQGLFFLILILLLSLYAAFNLLAKYLLIIIAIPVFFLGYIVYRDFNNKACIVFLYTIVIFYGIHVAFLLVYKFCVYINNI